MSTTKANHTTTTPRHAPARNVPIDGGEEQPLTQEEQLAKDKAEAQVKQTDRERLSQANHLLNEAMKAMDTASGQPSSDPFIKERLAVQAAAIRSFLADPGLENNEEEDEEGKSAPAKKKDKDKEDKDKEDHDEEDAEDAEDKDKDEKKSAPKHTTHSFHPSHKK